MISILILILTFSNPSEEALKAKATELAHKFIMIDGHIDVPYLLKENMQDIANGRSTGEFDFTRAKKGGLDAPFMSIYIPAEYQKTPGKSMKTALELMDMMDSIIAANPTKFAHAQTPADVRINFKNGLISLPYGLENGSPIENDLGHLQTLAHRGIRYITLAHSKANTICDSSYDPERPWGGLSPFGIEVIKEMNRLGIMIDVSHVSDSTFYQIMRLTQTPVIASHSSCRVFTPGFERNMSDDMIRQLAAKGGVIQINYGTYFLTQAGNTYSDRRRAYIQAYVDEHTGQRNESELRREARQQFMKANPYPFADISDVVNHIDHVVKLVGVDHVALGSDFDGVGDSLPTGLKTVEDLPNLVYHLLKRGYSEADIQKILGENVMRVWQQVIDYAAAQSH